MSAGAAILAWVLSAVSAWGVKPVPANEVARVDEVRQHAAESIVAVTYDPDEPPISSGPIGRAKTAILLTSIAGLETRFSEHVMMGHCVKPECDNGTSWGGWQMKVPPHGFRLVGTGFGYCFVRSADCYSANDLVDDWTLQVRSAIHMYRTLGARQWTTAPAAVVQAKDWLAKHPPPATDEQVLSGAMID